MRDHATYPTTFLTYLYRAPRKCLYLVARYFFLLLLNSSAWPCLGPAYQKIHTEPRKSLGTWLREMSSCSCLTFLPGPASVLLSKICKDFFSALYFFRVPCIIPQHKTSRDSATVGISYTTQLYAHIEQFGLRRGRKRGGGYLAIFQAAPLTTIARKFWILELNERIFFGEFVYGRIVVQTTDISKKVKR